MRTARLLIATAITLCMTIHATAVETVVRIQDTGFRRYHECNPTVQCETFVVYTKQESDANRAADVKLINELQEKIAAQGRDLKAISDMNDALTKRLDEMEKALAAKR